MPRYLSIRIIPKLGPKVCKHYLHLAVWNPGRHFTPNPKPIESPGGFGSFGSATGAAAALGCGGPGRSKGFAGHMGIVRAFLLQYMKSWRDLQSSTERTGEDDRF